VKSSRFLLNHVKQQALGLQLRSLSSLTAQILTFAFSSADATRRGHGYCQFFQTDARAFSWSPSSKASESENRYSYSDNGHSPENNGSFHRPVAS
jgi:hypothetical protein